MCGERYPADFRHCPRDATRLEEATAPDTDPLLGTVLGDTYQILRVIGEGGMGRVYEASHTRLVSKRLAIKVLHGDLIRQALVVGRFLREAEATSALNHPGIVGILDVNQLSDGRPYIVAELLEGEHLGAYLARQGRLAIEDALSIVRPVCQALMAAHAKGIVHRDIKPENIFLVGPVARRSTRTIKVLDFGISSVGTAAAKITKTGTVIGTPTYMPPEQARGRRVDHRADVYAVGAILYEVLTGKCPFDGVDPMSTLASVLTDDPPRPRSLAPSIPRALESVVRKAMAKQPKDRHTTMRELDEALATFEAVAPAVPAAATAAAAAKTTSSSSKPPPPPPRRSEPPRTTARPARKTMLVPARLRDTLLGTWSAAAKDDPGAPARKQLATYALVSMGFVGVGCLDASLSIAHLIRGATPLSNSDVLHAGLSSFAISVPTCLLSTWFLLKRIWPNAPSVSQALDRTRHVLGACTGAYAGLSLMLRILAGTSDIDANQLAWKGWGIVAFALAAIMGGVAAHWCFGLRLRLRLPLRLRRPKPADVVTTT
jgi:serine/threonine-protein kinase